MAKTKASTVKAAVVIDLTDADDSSTTRKPSTQPRETKASKRAAAAAKKQKAATTASLEAFLKTVRNGNFEIDPAPTWLRINRADLRPTEKTTITLQNTAYPTYPLYGSDDHLPIFFASDPIPQPETIDKRYRCGPAWANMSCALDTFLWVSTVCNPRRTRNDVPSLSTLQKLDPLSRLVVEYVKLTLSVMTQAAIDALRDLILDVVKLDPRIEFKAEAGMDINELFEFAWRRQSPLHQFSFSTATVRACSGCLGYGTHRYRDVLGLKTLGKDEMSLQAQLQAWFAERKMSKAAICVLCHGPATEKRVVLDRLPELLLRQEGCAGRAWEAYFESLQIEVDVAGEVDVPRKETGIWKPDRVRATYKPVVLVIRDTASFGGELAHWFAASCLPCSDRSWSVYDGQGHSGKTEGLVREIKEASLVREGKKKSGRDVDVVIFKKMAQEEIE